MVSFSEGPVMAKKLTIWLPDDWANISDQNPDGPLTLVWDDPTASGAFQLSTAEYTGGVEPRPGEKELIQLAVGFGEQNQWGTLMNSFSGKCVMGAFGTAAFQRTRSMPPATPTYCQAWFLSNGLDFIFATFIAMHQPADRELVDAQRIAEGIDLR
jgi:hypothetical protein